MYDVPDRVASWAQVPPTTPLPLLLLVEEAAVRLMEEGQRACTRTAGGRQQSSTQVAVGTCA